MDPSVAAASIAAIASILCAAIVRMDSKKVNETHRQVTVNHHSSDSPTLLDRFDDLESSVKIVDNKLDHHIQWHLDRTDK